MPIQPRGSEVESLTRELLDKLRAHRAELEAEIARTSETISVLERQLSLPPTEAKVVHGPTIFAEGRKDEALLENVNRFAFKRNAFFGKTQRDAVVALLRAVREPLTINQMIDTLKSTGYQFKAQSPYRVLYGILRDAPEIQKHGTQYGLVEWKDSPPTANGAAMAEVELVEEQQDGGSD